MLSVLTCTVPVLVIVRFAPRAFAKRPSPAALMSDTWLAKLRAARSAVVLSGGGGGLSMALGPEALESLPTVSELVVSSILLLGGGGGAGGGGGTSMVTVRMRP